MDAELHGLSSVDLPAGPPQLPEDPLDCWVPVEADMGVRGEPGTDSFTFYVCTPIRLARTLGKMPHQFGRHLLIVERFDWSVLDTAIRQLIGDLSADTWNELASKIGRYGLWEFEDYVEAEKAY